MSYFWHWPPYISQRLSPVLLAVLCVWPCSALAKKKATPKPTAVAFFSVLPQGKVAANVVQELNHTLAQKLVEAQAQALTDSVLSQRLGTHATLALERCSGDAGCVAKLGQKVGAYEVVYGYAGNNRKVTRVEMSVVNVLTGKVQRRVAFEIGPQKTVGAVVQEHFSTLFKLPYPEAFLELPPLEDLRDPIAPADAAQTPSTDQDTSGPLYLTYAGIGAGAIGLALLGGGIGFGLKAQNTYAQANAKDTNGRYLATTQRASQLKREGDNATNTANLFYGFGAFAVALGGTLISLDLFLPSTVRTNVTVSAHGAQGHITLPW